MGEPGRPVWPLWELLKWLVGKSDHTMAAICKETTWLPFDSCNVLSSFCGTELFFVQCWPSSRRPMGPKPRPASSRRKRSCRRSLRSCWELMASFSTRHTPGWRPNTTTPSSEPSTSPTPVSGPADTSQLTALTLYETHELRDSENLWIHVQV